MINETECFLWKKIFDDFARKYIPAFEELKDDEKNSRDVLNSIFDVTSKTLKSLLQCH